MRLNSTWKRRKFLRAIVVVGGEGRPGLTLCSSMLQPGEEKIVAE